MFNHVGYRAPPIRSSMGRSFIPRSGSGGGGAGFSADDAPVVTEIEHQPGFWAAYGTQSVIVGVMFLLGGLTVLMGLTATDGNKATGFVRVMVVPSSALMIISVVLLALFYARYQKMTKVFDDAMEEQPEARSELNADLPDAHAPDRTDLVAHHPNPGRFTHGTWITGLVAIIVSLSCVELVAGLVLLFYADANTTRLAHGSLVHVFSLALIVQGAANLGLAYAIKQHRMGALGWVILLSIMSVVAAVLTLQWYFILYATVTCGLFWAAGYTLSKMDGDIAGPEKSDPLEAYYHNLLTLLVHVMRADGHCDRRELSKITRQCDSMNLSDYERDLVIASTNEHPLEPLADVVTRYRMAADLAHVPDPAQTLIVAAVTVAAADGELAEAERVVIEDLAQQVGVNAALYEAALLTHAPEHSSPEAAARALLNVTDTDNDDQLEAAHRELRAELDAAHYAHLGRRLAKSIQERLIRVDEAYELLRRNRVTAP